MHTIQILLTILQLTGLVLFTHSAYSIKKSCDIEITIYNFPIAIMMFMSLFIGSYLCVMHSLFYFLIGMLIGTFSLILNTFVPPGDEIPSLYRKATSFFTALLFWHQLIAILIMIFSNKDKLNYEKL